MLNSWWTLVNRAVFVVPVTVQPARRQGQFSDALSQVFISPFSPANAFCIHIYVLHQTFKVQHPDTHFLLPYPKYRCLTTVKIFRLPLSSQEMEMIHSQKEREARQITHFLAMFGLQAAPNPLTQVVSSHPYPFPCTPLPYPPIFPTKRISHHARL